MVAHVTRHVAPVRARRRRRKFRTCRAVSRCSRSVVAMSENTRREKQLLYNTLAIVLKAVEKHQTQVDLRNEATVVGVVDHADA